MKRISYLVTAPFLIALEACSTSSSKSPFPSAPSPDPFVVGDGSTLLGGDAGASGFGDDALAPADAAAESEGGCIAPTAGAPCRTDDTACQAADMCCGGVWSCDPLLRTWQLWQADCCLLSQEAGSVSGPPVSGISLSCDFEPSDYDNSCQVDSDCVAVPQGDLCTQLTCEIGCKTGAVNARVAPAYKANVAARTAAQYAHWSSTVCHCPGATPVAARCRQGTCANR